MPMAIADDVTISINWHELRILTIWATNYANDKFPNSDSRRNLQKIINRLHRQHPDRLALTLAGEMVELRKAYGKVETNIPPDPLVEA
jgi:hypothetical protein